MAKRLIFVQARQAEALIFSSWMGGAPVQGKAIQTSSHPASTPANAHPLPSDRRSESRHHLFGCCLPSWRKTTGEFSRAVSGAVEFRSCLFTCTAYSSLSY